MRNVYKVALICLLAAALAVVGVGACDGPEPTPMPTPPEQPPPPQPPAAAPADLLLTEIRVERNNDPGLNYRIVAGIMNIGMSDASGFSAGCVYRCPPGDTITSGGLDIVQGGYLAARKAMTYQSAFRYQCTVPSSSINLDCDVDSFNDVSESNENNNIRQVSLPLP
ncbi:MAG: hypothetical protein H3C34_22575 [Caldilineaceae bacterium]|nr:hypothetical protein [Caldilineaceae bacterium]